MYMIDCAEVYKCQRETDEYDKDVKTTPIFVSGTFMRRVGLD